MSPTAETKPDGTKTLVVEKTVFDLDSREDVTVAKVGTFTPVKTMDEFVSRLGNDANAILAIVNDGLEEYTNKQLLADEAVPWQAVEEDEKGERTLVPFTGTLLSPEQSVSLKKTVISFASLLYGYAKNMVPGDKTANAAAKKAAKDKARDAILSNPAALEALRKK